MAMEPLGDRSTAAPGGARVKFAVTVALPVIVKVVLAAELLAKLPPLPVQLLKT